MVAPYATIKAILAGRGAPGASCRLRTCWSALFVEERRRLKIFPNAFGEKAVLKLMFGAMTRAAERWRSIRITEFERRQMAALRQELDQDYETTIDLDQTRSKPASATAIPSNIGLDQLDMPRLLVTSRVVV